MNMLHGKREAEQKKRYRSTLLLPLKTVAGRRLGRQGRVGREWGSLLVEHRGSSCHLHKQSSKRLFICVHLPEVFVGKESLMSAFSEYGLGLNQSLK